MSAFMLKLIKPTCSFLSYHLQGNAAGGTDVSGDTLQGHNGACACGFCDAGLLRGGDVHDDAALEHLGELAVKGLTFGELVSHSMISFAFLMMMKGVLRLFEHIEITKFELFRKTRLIPE